MENKQICKRCACDSEIPGISFDETGMCNYCRAHDRLEKLFPIGNEGKQIVEEIITKIKSRGRNSKYDCLIGVSGGTDSTFVLYLAKKYGLRPLAVHYDNGWNSEISDKNVKSAVSALDIDLKVIKADFDEFKELQIAFLNASVPDAEIPTDLAIHSILQKTAAEEGIHYILNGMNFRTEGIQPLEWSYMDGKYVKNIIQKFGKTDLNDYPNLTILDMFNYCIINKIQVIPILAYLDYSKEETREILQKELNWEYYGGHHFESIYTRFIITDILWDKFGIDKRKIQLSGAVRSGKINRQEALETINVPPIKDSQITEHTIKKLGISKEEYERILNLPKKTFHDYPTHYPLIKSLKLPIKTACRMNILPDIFYEKYIGVRE